MIKAIFCDFYGTVVYEDDEPIKAIIERIYKSGYATSKKEIGTYWWQRFSALCADSYSDSFRMQRELELQSLHETLERFGAKDDVIELSRPQFEYWKAPPIFVDSKPFFEKCHVPIFVVSNIDTADLNSALKYHSLNPAGVVTSEEAQAYKPNQKIFKYALNKFKLKPIEVIHVGDSITSDVIGARSAGIKPVWINRKGKSKTPDVVSQITNLYSLIDEHGFIFDEH